jgi:hypothetical protein
MRDATAIVALPPQSFGIDLLTAVVHELASV